MFVIKRELKGFSKTEAIKKENKFVENVKKASTDSPLIMRKVSFNVSPEKVKNKPSTKENRFSLYQSNSLKESNSMGLLGENTNKEKISCAVILTETTKPSILNNSNSQNASTSLLASNSIRLESEEITLQENEPFEQESFADMFFIAGIPKKNAKVVTDSKYFSAPCKHKDCSMLHSYKSDVLYRFPLSNYKGLNLCSSVYIYFI
jgi:hypothetical protein